MLPQILLILLLALFSVNCSAWAQEKVTPAAKSDLEALKKLSGELQADLKKLEKQEAQYGFIDRTG